MPRHLVLSVLSLRYSSWSMRAWLALEHAGADFETRTVDLTPTRQGEPGVPVGGAPQVADALGAELSRRRQLGSVTGLFPVLRVDGTPIHEALAICEWAAEAFPGAELWPADPLRRARARSLAAEMASGFANLRSNLPCHMAAFVPGFAPDGPTLAEIRRVLELWRDCLNDSGGPFLFGSFGIVDAMYFPVLTRFHTYGVALPGESLAYADNLERLPAVAALRAHARTAPAMPVYDDYIRDLGGDPLAWR